LVICCRDSFDIIELKAAGSCVICSFELDKRLVDATVPAGCACGAVAALPEPAKEVTGRE
jgi:hypothetical protein